MEQPTPAPESFRQVIELWPTRAAMARDIKAIGRASRAAPVRQWHHKDQIAEAWFDAIIRAAKQRGFAQVTYAALAAIYKRRAGQAD